MSLAIEYMTSWMNPTISDLSISMIITCCLFHARNPLLLMDGKVDWIKLESLSGYVRAKFYNVQGVTNKDFFKIMLYFNKKFGNHIDKNIIFFFSFLPNSW